VFSSSWFIHAAKENPLPSTMGSNVSDTFMDEFTKRNAPVAVPGLPLVVVTPAPSVPSVAIWIGGGDDEENGQVLLHTVDMQFGAKDAVASVVYLQ